MSVFYLSRLSPESLHSHSALISALICAGRTPVHSPLRLLACWPAGLLVCWSRLSEQVSLGRRRTHFFSFLVLSAFLDGGSPASPEQATARYWHPFSGLPIGGAGQTDWKKTGILGVTRDQPQCALSFWVRRAIQSEG